MAANNALILELVGEPGYFSSIFGTAQSHGSQHIIDTFLDDLAKFEDNTLHLDLFFTIDVIDQRNANRIADALLSYEGTITIYVKNNVCDWGAVLCMCADTIQLQKYATMGGGSVKVASLAENAREKLERLIPNLETGWMRDLARFAISSPPPSAPQLDLLFRIAGAKEFTRDFTDHLRNTIIKECCSYERLNDGWEQGAEGSPRLCDGWDQGIEELREALRPAPPRQRGFDGLGAMMQAFVPGGGGNMY